MRRRDLLCARAHAPFLARVSAAMRAITVAVTCVRGATCVTGVAATMLQPESQTMMRLRGSGRRDKKAGSGQSNASPPEEEVEKEVEDHHKEAPEPTALAYQYAQRGFTLEYRM